MKEEIIEKERRRKISETMKKLIKEGKKGSFKKGHIPWNIGRKIKRKCIICKKEFESILARHNKNLKYKVKYCSKKCFYKGKKGIISWNKGQDGKDKFICKICKKSFFRYKSQSHLYCSRKCFSKTLIGNKFNVGIIRDEKEREKRRIGNLRRYEKFGYINSPKTREKIRKNTINRIRKEKGHFKVFIGKYEKEILDGIEKSNNIKLIRQYGIGGYFIDGYNKKYNIAFEIDERHHFSKHKKEKDIERENYIKSKLNCEFIRIPCVEL